MFKIIIKYILKFIMGTICFALLYTCAQKADPELGGGLLKIFAICFGAYETILILEDIDKLNK